MSNVEIVESYEYKLSCANDESLPAFVKEHVAKYGGKFVLWDPLDNEEGFRLSGDDPESIAAETIEHLELYED